MGTAIGIDLGTTDCCVFAVKDGTATLVRSRSGTPTTPAIVAFGRTGEILVGEAARRQASYNPERTLQSVKRLLGRKYHSPAISWLREACPYALVPARNGDVWVRVDERDYSPPEIIAYLLEHLKARAEDELDDQVEAAVITVPTYFGERQRRAILNAAKIANVPVRGLINATSAAALAHGTDAGNNQRIALMDLGGGSYGVTIVEYGGGNFEVLAHAGDTLLGGDDFDRCIVDHLVDAFHSVEHIDLTESPSALYRLFESARTAKHELSFSQGATAIELPCIAERNKETLHLRHPGLSRQLFESLAAEELDRLGEPCAWALEDLGLGTDDINEVLLIGAMTRMPAVQQRAQVLFRKRPRQAPGAGEIVAKGAALHAAVLQGQLKKPVLREATAHSVGIKVRGGRFSTVLGRTTPVPSRQQKAFAPARGDQDRVVLEVYQGESDLVRDNTYLGRFLLEEIVPNTPIVTAFAFDESGLLTVSTVDPTSGRDRPVKILSSGGLTATQVARLIEDRMQVRPTLPPASERVVRATAEQATTIALREARRSVRPPPPAGRQPRVTTPSAQGQPMEVGTDSLVGTTVGGRYVIEAILADGGMGRVYRARHVMLNKEFAIKVLHAELAEDADLADRFVLEAQAASAIRSEHVVDISDFGHLEDGTAYFVMEYLEGDTLAMLIEQHGALPVGLVCYVGAQLADGLAAAHDMDIVHRDLKPENITLMERVRGEYLCKILDFGIAKQATSDTRKRLTLAGELLGTPYYMAPEQIDGGDVDPRSDIYALGTVLYEMATGYPPFDADTLVSILLQHKTTEPKPIAQDAEGRPFPPELQAIISQCLAKKPVDRFESARALAARLRALRLDG